jgi:hypothetical protein
MIEAVGATLAPFVYQEKPKVSPWLAASLIKNGPASAAYGLSASIAALQETTKTGRLAARLCLLLLAFCDVLPQRKHKVCPGKLAVGRASTRRNDAAHLDSRPDSSVPIWCRASQFCNT